MRPVKTKVKIWFKSAPQRLSRGSQFLTASWKWFVWVPPHLASYSINVLSCPRTHRITLISIYQTFRIKVLHSLTLYKLLNLIEYILWRIFSENLFALLCRISWWYRPTHKILFLGWEDYCCNLLYKKSTCIIKEK